MQRHEHDTVTQLWPGSADPTSLRYVPVELRDLVAAIDPTTERKMTKELARMSEVVATDTRGKAHTLNPADNDGDLETCLSLRKVAWARSQLAGERAAAEMAARDRVNYSCAGCGQVVPISALNRTGHTQRRTLIDGTTIVCCGQCAADAEYLVTERRLADRTHRDRMLALITAATS